jgi:EAL domain-containing protein (putative c-di-GMP-specific phosphodiesterase class I)
MLLGLGCTMAQGWLYGKAMAPEALARRLWAPGGTLARTAPWRPEGAQL